MAKIMHEYGGVCFVDFAASAPYAEINMHPEDPLEKLDAIFLGNVGIMEQQKFCCYQIIIFFPKQAN